MRKFFIVLLVIFLGGMIFSYARAQDVNPPLPDIGTPTATAEATSGLTATPSPTQTVLEFTDEAETGSEIYILAGLSLIGGLGIYFIKKYLDNKRYSL